MFWKPATPFAPDIGERLLAEPDPGTFVSKHRSHRVTRFGGNLNAFPSEATTMTITTRGFLFATALVLFLGGGAPVQAQDEVCYWGNTVGDEHGFILGGLDCLEENQLPGTTCVVCVLGTDEHEGCHYALMDGEPHDGCDDGTAALAALTRNPGCLGGRRYDHGCDGTHERKTGRFCRVYSRGWPH